METNDAFISYLRKKMISEEPSADELISMLDKRLLELNAHQDRVKLLNEIENLRKDSIIDVYYKGIIQDFFNYAKFRVQDGKDASKIKKDWSGLFRDLDGKYIKDVSQLDFNEIMKYRRLPNGTVKIKWITKKTEAVYFQKEFGFSMPQFNACFMWWNGSNFAEKHRHHTSPNMTFIDIMTKHKHQ